MSKPRDLRLGPVASGTLQDVISALADALDDLRLTRQARAIVRKARALDWDLAHDLEALDDLYVDLSAIAEGHCPDYSYFGIQGVTIGVWPDPDVLTGDFVPRSRKTFQLPSEAQRAGDIGPDATHFVSVTDHGNATLYRRVGARNRWQEVWSVV